MEVVQTLAFATPRFLSWSFDARLLTPTACCTPAAVDFRSRPIPNSHSHARSAVGSRAASSSLMADGLWRPAGTRVRRTFAPDFRGPSQASACWQA